MTNCSTIKIKHMVFQTSRVAHDFVQKSFPIIASFLAHARDRTVVGRRTGQKASMLDLFMGAFQHLALITFGLVVSRGHSPHPFFLALVFVITFLFPLTLFFLGTSCNAPVVTTCDAHLVTTHNAILGHCDAQLLASICADVQYSSSSHAPQDSRAFKAQHDHSLG